MKKLAYFLLLISTVTSCTASISDIPPNKMNYVKSAILCDSKSTDFKITNEEDLVEFFNNETGSVVIKYKFSLGKNNKYGIVKNIKIIRGRNGEKRFYLASFKRITFPMSDCRKLKTVPKVF